MTTRADDYGIQQLQEHSSARAREVRAKAKIRTEQMTKAKPDHATHAAERATRQKEGGGNRKRYRS